MGRLFEIYCTEVYPPDSISIYPVGITSRPYSFMIGAPRTCSSIRYWLFLPEISDVNKMASASGEIWLCVPGKIITGTEEISVMSLTAWWKFV